MATPAEILITGGVVATLASVVGGGMKAFGAELPLIASLRRQLLLFCIGTAFVALGLYLRSMEIVRPERQETAPTKAEPAPITPPGAEVRDEQLLSYYAPDNRIEQAFGRPEEERPFGDGIYRHYVAGDEIGGTWFRDYRQNGQRIAMGLYTEVPGIFIPNSGDLLDAYTLRDALADCSAVEFDSVALAYAVHDCTTSGAIGYLYRAFIFGTASPRNQTVAINPQCTGDLSERPAADRIQFLRRQCAQTLSMKASGVVLSDNQAVLEEVLPHFLAMLYASQ